MAVSIELENNNMADMGRGRKGMAGAGAGVSHSAGVFEREVN